MNGNMMQSAQVQANHQYREPSPPKSIMQQLRDKVEELRANLAQVDSWRHDLAQAERMLAAAEVPSVIGSGTISSGVITLSFVKDAANFDRNMVIVPSSINGRAVEDGAMGLGFVLRVDTDRGIVMVSPTQGGSTGTPSMWLGSMTFVSKGAR